MKRQKLDNKENFKHKHDLQVCTFSQACPQNLKGLLDNLFVSESLFSLVVVILGTKSSGKSPQYLATHSFPDRRVGWGENVYWKRELYLEDLLTNISRS